MPGAASPGTHCADCQLRPPLFDRARAPLLYAYPVDAVVQSLKFRSRLWLTPAFAELLMPVLQEEFGDADALVPVPLHRWRQARRGFNQATEICKPLARATGLPVLYDARRIRPTPSQSGLTAAERRRNLKGAFAVTGKLSCRHPLIVDDVMTTGETCNQLARVLRKAGATSVGVLTLARAVVR